MTYQEFRKEYPSFRSIYIYCMENQLENKLLDWLDSDYDCEEYSENMYNTIQDFLIHWNVIEEDKE